MKKKERSKQGQTNSKAKQHNTPKAVTFPKKNELPRVRLEPTTLYTLDRVLYHLRQLSWLDPNLTSHRAPDLTGLLSTQYEGEGRDIKTTNDTKHHIPSRQHGDTCTFYNVNMLYRSITKPRPLIPAIYNTELVEGRTGILDLSYIHVHVQNVIVSNPTQSSSFFFGKATALGVLCCFALLFA